MASENTNETLLKRWLLILGSKPDAPESEAVPFSAEEKKLTTALSLVYGDEKLSTKGKNASIRIGNWLDDINSLFDAEMSKIIQQDAIDRYGLRLLLESDQLLDAVIPDIQLAQTILQYKDILPDTAKDRARQIIRRIAEQLMAKFQPELYTHIAGHIYSKQRQTNKKSHNPDWLKTITANLRHYQPDFNTIIPEKLITRKKLRKQIRSVCILIDQSYSMSDSICHAAIFACIFHQIQAIETYFIPFSNTVVNLSNLLDDPVESMFAIQLGGSTNISQAIRFAYQQVTMPQECLLIIISDLAETDDESALEELIPYLPGLFKKTMVILSLNQEGKGTWDEYFMQQFVRNGITCIASTPEQFPRLVSEVMLNN